MPKDYAAKIRVIEEGEAFKNKSGQDLKEIANNTNVLINNSEAINDNKFTYDGGTKKFLAYDAKLNSLYYLKEYTLRSVGNNVEVWVANDFSYQEYDTRTSSLITQKQVDELVQEFDTNIYKKDTEFFGTPDKRLGEYSSFAMKDNATDEEKNYYKTTENKVILLYIC